ncbi:hypothetical protein HY641_05000 [Candidatus Woesearchaeota archaeon]|nr:hypothetical protein [Candidatus Woesearchaeota archaeon]
MKDVLKEPLHRIEIHVDTAVSEFTLAHPSKSLYSEMGRRCEQSIVDLGSALQALESLQDKRHTKEITECLLTMSFFLGKMRDETKGRISQAVQLENAILVMASLEILRRNWAEVKSAYMRFLELTEDTNPPQHLQMRVHPII